MAAETSILKSVKKVLGIDPDYTEFDQDVIMHINSAFTTLHQLAVGPDIAFEIEDDTAQWSQFFGEQQNIQSAKTYVYLSVRLVFDIASTTSFVIEALTKQKNELEWRLNVVRENVLHAVSAPAAPGFANSQGVWNLTGGIPFPEEAEIGDIGVDYVSGNVWRKA